MNVSGIMPSPSALRVIMAAAVDLFMLSGWEMS
jgi:hypothetical protein